MHVHMLLYMYLLYTFTFIHSSSTLYACRPLEDADQPLADKYVQLVVAHNLIGAVLAMLGVEFSRDVKLVTDNALRYVKHLSQICMNPFFVVQVRKMIVRYRFIQLLFYSSAFLAVIMSFIFDYCNIAFIYILITHRNRPTDGVDQISADVLVQPAAPNYHI